MRAREVIAQNLGRLMEARPALDSLKKITAASDGRLSNGTLDRIRRATHATGVDTVEELAHVFGLEPWQLLVPNLNPKALPALAGPELLAAIRTMVLGENADPLEHPTEGMAEGSSGRKGALGRFPGEYETHATRGKGKSVVEVDRSGKAAKKRGGGHS